MKLETGEIWMEPFGSGYRMQDAGGRIQDAGCRIQDARFRIQDAG